MKNNAHSNRYVGTVVFKCNTVFIEPDESFDYEIKYLGDSSKLHGGYRVLFELDKKISNYVFSARIIKVLDNTFSEKTNENCKKKVKLNISNSKNL